MSDQKLTSELMMSFGKLEAMIQSVDKRLEKHEKNSEEQQKMLYKLTENQQILNHLVEDLKELKEEIKENEKDYKKKIDDLSKKVNDNEKVTKNIKWFFGIVVTIITSVAAFGLKDHFFGK